MKPYPKYKDSGVSWLGEVPEHWDSLKIRTILNCRTERNRPDLPLLSVVREKGVIKRNIENKEENHNYIPEDLTNYKVVKSGQFAMNKMKAWQGSYGVSAFDGIVSPAYFVFDINNVRGEFFHLAMRSKAYVPFFTSASDGVRIGQWDLNQNRMKEIPFFVPPESEQTQIARYLDWQTSKINKFIKNKKKLIALLKEQKQNIINEAVTKGINPNVKMKNSGVEWIGEIPEHWEVRKLKYCIHGKLKYGANASGVEYSTKYPRYIRITDFNSHGHLDQTNKLSLNIERYEEYLLDEGDLLFARSGATVGKVFQCKKLDETSCFAGYLIKAKPNKSIATSDFLYLYTQSFAFDRWKTSIFNKATIENIGADKYSQLIVVIPPIKEQDHIFKKLQKEAAIIDKTIARTEKEIELIQEYRTRLVSDVVTGKIDVRDVEIPDFVEETVEMEENEEDLNEEQNMENGDE